jgi:hypothetical protein
MASMVMVEFDQSKCPSIDEQNKSPRNPTIV